MRSLAFTVVLASMSTAWAWQPLDPDNPRFQVSDTRVTRLLVGLGSVNGPLHLMWAVFEDSTAEVCNAQPQLPQFDQTEPPTAMAYLGGAGDSGVRIAYSTLLTARASGSPVRVVIDTQTCSVFNVSL